MYLAGLGQSVLPLDDNTITGCFVNIKYIFVNIIITIIEAINKYSNDDKYTAKNSQNDNYSSLL